MTESADASVVSVILEPATKVSVSLLESAATFDCPLTAIVPNAFPPADIELNDKLPEPSVTKACPLEPSLDGYVKEAIVAPGAVIACEKSNSSSDASHNSVASVEALTAS